jgi:uncharacterized membrane protein YfcA
VPEFGGWAVLLAGAFGASIVGGVAGFGAGIVLLPLVAWVVGFKAAVPVLTVTMFIGNLSRLWWSRRDVDLGVVGAFLAGAVPATALGAVLYAGASAESLGRLVGVFLLASVPLRRLLTSTRVRIRLRHFPLVGGTIGLLSALVVTTGPVATPFFLAYGLRRGAYLATESLCSTGMHLVRGAVLARYALLTWDTVVVGVALGAVMFAGAWLARRLVDRMSERVFLVVIEALLVALGLQFVLVPR